MHSTTPKELSWDQAVERFTNFLLAERNASSQTIRAYTTDLSDFAAFYVRLVELGPVSAFSGFRDQRGASSGLFTDAAG